MASSAEVVTKSCSKCKDTKPLTGFHPKPSRRAGFQSWCKDCARVKARENNRANPDRHRKWALRNYYGITIDQYDAMLKVQGGGCAICGGSCGTGKRLAVDHVKDSSPPQVRGLLCARHNTGIGLFNHDEELLENAVRYLNATTH